MGVSSCFEVLEVICDPNKKERERRQEEERLRKIREEEKKN